MKVSCGSPKPSPGLHRTRMHFESVFICLLISFLSFFSVFLSFFFYILCMYQQVPVKNFTSLHTTFQSHKMKLGSSPSADMKQNTPEINT